MRNCNNNNNKEDPALSALRNVRAFLRIAILQEQLEVDWQRRHFRILRPGA